jgi:hypothetical protein
MSRQGIPSTGSTPRSVTWLTVRCYADGMSAYGPKRTRRPAVLVSAFGGKAAACLVRLRVR